MLFLIFIIFSIFAVNPVSAKELQVGVSPLMLDLGTVGKGESVVGSFFIVTSSKDEIVVKLKSSRSNFDFFKKKENIDIVHYVSEEDSSGWVYFPENPYVLKYEDDQLNTKSGTISDWEKVNFVLNVPDDADSCYHAFKIEPIPYATKEEGTSVDIIAMVAITVKFKVEGDCEVRGEILDIMQDSSSKYIDIGVYFKNTGTATVSLFSPEVMILYENGTLLDKTRSGYLYVAPGDIGVLNARFNPNKVHPGNYLLNSTVAYGANTTSKQVTLTIEEPKIIDATVSVPVTTDGINYNFFLLFAIIILIAYKIYKRDN
ncbi:MAG: hypothetical protein GQ477_03410 [Nanohaloarchaea archaeon]|nr:hypothetical protein [Candidatus Nanohaloarchaea archaeon]